MAILSRVRVQQSNAENRPHLRRNLNEPRDDPCGGGPAHTEFLFAPESSALLNSLVAPRSVRLQGMSQIPQGLRLLSNLMRHSSFVWITASRLTGEPRYHRAGSPIRPGYHRAVVGGRREKERKRVRRKYNDAAKGSAGEKRKTQSNVLVDESPADKFVRHRLDGMYHAKDRTARKRKET